MWAADSKVGDWVGDKGSGNSNHSDAKSNELGDSEEVDKDDKREIIDPEDFPTLSLTLEEARRQFDDEESRRDAVESKIGIVVTVDALIISFVALFTSLHPIGQILTSLPALASAGLGLYAIRSRHYDRPGKDIQYFHDYSKYQNEGSQREKLLLDYEVAVGRNKEKNDPKFRWFNICVIFTFISLVLILITPVVSYFGVFEWMVEQVASVLI